MKRSLKFALRFANSGKKAQLDQLWETYRDAVNFFVEDQEITDEAKWRDCQLDLGAGFKQAALRQAIGLLKSRKTNCIPVLTHPCMILDRRFIKVGKSQNSFDYWIKISTLEKGCRISTPIKSYNHANKYFRRWDMINGGKLLRNDQGDWFIQLVFQKKKRRAKATKAKGLDIGYRKLITDSNGKIYGIGIKALTEKATQKQQGSKAEKRAREEIKNYIGKIVKEAVTGRFNIVIEDLKGLKDNKSGKWSKVVNRRFNYWFYSLILQRIRDRAELFGVRCKSIPPQYTSQTCPKCGCVDKSNRQGEKFKCLQCGFSGDADHIAAINILRRGFAQEAP